MKQSSASIGIVVAEFNRQITDALLAGALSRLQLRGVARDNTQVVWVPGAIELPLMAQQMAKTRRYQAIICLGAVIRGDTDHYDYVCQSVAYGCQRVALDQSLPVIFGVLTTDTEEQAFARIGGSHGHKGEEAAEAALVMIRQLNGASNERQSNSAGDLELV